jgi:hypothetical protein
MTKHLPDKIGRDDCEVFPADACTWPLCGCEKRQSDLDRTGEVMEELASLASSSVFTKEARAMFSDAARLLEYSVQVLADLEPVQMSVEKILDEYSAWVAMPNKEVAKKIALASTFAAHGVALKCRELEEHQP